MLNFNAVKLPILMIFAGLLVYAACVQAQNEEWEFKKSKNGIDVYTRSILGKKVKEFKAVTVVNTKKENILKNLLTPETYSEWMDGIESAKLIKRVGDTYYIYSRLKFPWPFDDREEFTTTEIIKDTTGTKILCKINILKDFGNSTEGLVRIIDGYGSWLLEDGGNGKTKVVFRFYADPAGNLPKSIVNMFIEDSPYNTLLSLKKMYP